MKTKRLWIVIVILVLLSPLGLLVPEVFKAGGAWGEWGPEELKELTGYVPEKLERLSGLWKSPMPDYAFKGWDEGLKGYAAYILSGIAGLSAVVFISYILGKILTRKNRAKDNGD